MASVKRIQCNVHFFTLMRGKIVQTSVYTSHTNWRIMPSIQCEGGGRGECKVCFSMPRTAALQRQRVALNMGGEGAGDLD